MKIIKNESNLNFLLLSYTLRVLMQTMGIITTTASPAALHIIHMWLTAKYLKIFQKLKYFHGRDSWIK